MGTWIIATARPQTASRYRLAPGSSELPTAITFKPSPSDITGLMLFTKFGTNPILPCSGPRFPTPTLMASCWGRPQALSATLIPKQRSFPVGSPTRTILRPTCMRWRKRALCGMLMASHFIHIEGRVPENSLYDIAEFESSVIGRGSTAVAQRVGL